MVCHWYREPPHHKRYPWVGKDSFSHRDALKRGDGAVEYNVAFSFSSFFKIWRETSRGFEPRSLDSESRVLTVTPRGRLPQKTSGSDCSLWKYTLGLVPLEEREHFERSHVLLDLLHISLGA